MESREINIVMLAVGEEFIKGYEKLNQRIKDNYPNVHLYRINPSKNYKEELDKLKNIKFDALVSLPFFINVLSYILDSFPSIKWVHSLAAGIENFFKIEKIFDDNIIFSNSRGAYSETLGEMGIVSMMYFSYNINAYIENMKNKEWMAHTNNTLYNKTLLIIGYGNNGLCLAKRAKNGFNMKIIAVKKRITGDYPGKEYVDELYSLDSLPDNAINKADYIYATLPETEETMNIFDKKFFKKMNKNSVFINVGRGNAVVEDDIIYALENDVIRGALLDVTRVEPLNKDSKLYNISPNKLLITNHSLCINDGRIDDGFNFFYKDLEHYLKTGKPLTIVDKKRKY
jgi:phosphoglycerate dehydrogenase-like enzyme